MLLQFSIADWSKIIEDIGIIGGLVGVWVGILTYRQGNKDKQTANLMAMAARGEALWDKIENDPSLGRVLAYQADLSKAPTLAESRALNRIFKLYQDGWRVASATDRNELNSLAIDIVDFLKRPLPSAIWEQKKRFRNPEFLRFVNRAIAS